MPKARIAHYLKEDTTIACNRNRPKSWCYTKEVSRVTCKSCHRIIATGSVQLSLRLKRK